MRSIYVLSTTLLLLGCDQSQDLGRNGGTTGALPEGGKGGDMPAPMTGSGTVPHYIDADTGEDLGPVLDLKEIVYSLKLKAPLSLNAVTRAYYFVAECKGNPKAIAAPTISPLLRQPLYALGPTGTYWKLAGRPTTETQYYWFEDDHGAMVCRSESSSGSIFDDYTDTDVPGKVYGNGSLRIELR